MPDLTRRRRLSDLEQQIRDHCAEAARNLWRTGRALAEVRDEELWREADYPGFDAWLQAAGLLGRSSAYKAMRIASEFSEDQAARFGTEKLAAGIRLLTATAKEEEPGDLLAGSVTIRNGDGTFESVPFVQASPVQIHRAAAQLGHTRRQRGVPKDLRSKLELLHRDLAKAKPSLQATKVAARQDRQGRVLVSVTAMPLEDLEEFVAVMRARLVGEPGHG
jgi:hypothetical protein